MSEARGLLSSGANIKGVAVTGIGTKGREIRQQRGDRDEGRQTL